MENKDSDLVAILPSRGSVVSQNITPLFANLPDEEIVNVMLYLLDHTYACEDQPFLWSVYQGIPGFLGDDKPGRVIESWNGLTLDHEYGKLSLSIDHSPDGLYNVLCLDWDKVTAPGVNSGSNPELISERFNKNEIIQLLFLIKDYAYDVNWDGPSGHITLPDHV